MTDAFTSIAMVCAWIAMAAVIFTFVITMTRFSLLPARIPVHFNVMGRPDRWGGRRMVWIYPAISLVMMIVLSIAARASIREASLGQAESARTSLEATAMFAAYVAVLLAVILLRAIAVAEQRATGLGRLFLPLLLLGVVLIVIRYRT